MRWYTPWMLRAMIAIAIAVAVMIGAMLLVVLNGNGYAVVGAMLAVAGGALFGTVLTDVMRG